MNATFTNVAGDDDAAGPRSSTAGHRCTARGSSPTAPQRTSTEEPAIAVVVQADGPTRASRRHVHRRPVDRRPRHRSSSRRSSARARRSSAGRSSPTPTWSTSTALRVDQRPHRPQDARDRPRPDGGPRRAIALERRGRRSRVLDRRSRSSSSPGSGVAVEEHYGVAAGHRVGRAPTARSGSSSRVRSRPSTPRPPRPRRRPTVRPACAGWPPRPGRASGRRARPDVAGRGAGCRPARCSWRR